MTEGRDKNRGGKTEKGTMNEAELEGTEKKLLKKDKKKRQDQKEVGEKRSLK